MTERDDQLQAGNRRHQPDGTDQGAAEFGTTLQARDPRHAILGRGHDRICVRTGSVSQ